MRKHLLVFSLLLLSSLNLFAQAPARATIKGLICDSVGISIPSAAVMLLDSKDSTLINFTSSDEKGEFEFKNIKNSGYLLKISMMSYYPYQQILPVSASGINDLGKIKLKMVARLLLEVVIKAARAPLTFRGDTIEYDAASFQVPPGSTVEDLLRRLPGLEVDFNGNIKSQGKDVRRLYVDGKTFFSNDPKFATQNLGAETISKVQVFDEKSEQSKLTGIDDGVKNTKAMNLKLKDEYKKGAFGKLTVAAGDQKRWALKGNYNRFDKKQQFSVIGYANNSNAGIDLHDYEDFMGIYSEIMDNGDFGFGRDAEYMEMGGGLSVYFGGGGLVESYGSGINYNFENKKTLFNSNYIYSQATRKLFQTSNKETFLQSTSFKNADTTNSKEFRESHNIEMRVQHQIDSADLLIAKTNVKFSNSNSNYSRFSFYYDSNDITTRKLNTENKYNNNSWNINSAVIYRHRFKKKGANLAWSGGFNSDKSVDMDNPFSINKFFEAKTYTEQIIALNANNNDTKNQFKSSMLLTEPLSKAIYLETFYNFKVVNTTQDKLTENSALPNTRVDSLTAYYTNDILINRIGATIRYNKNGLNASIGLAAQQLQMKGKYALCNDLPDLEDPIHKTWSNLVPDINLRYELSKFIYLYSSYTMSVNVPTMNQLMPVVNINNPAFIIQGNPDLQPSRTHSINISPSYSNHASMIELHVPIFYNITQNSISNIQTITMVDKVGIQTVTRPENMKGSNNSYGFSPEIYLNLIKTKLSMRASGGLEIGNEPTFINAVQNVLNYKSTSLSTNFNLTATKKLALGLSGSLSLNDIKYSFRKDLNQKVRNYRSNFYVKWQLLTKSYFETTFNYSVYKNASFGFNRNIPLWNASWRQVIGKSNKIDMRLAVFDIFNKNQSISQSATENYVINTTANQLARYFMLSISYNIKGFDIKNNR